MKTTTLPLNVKTGALCVSLKTGVFRIRVTLNYIVMFCVIKKRFLFLSMIIVTCVCGVKKGLYLFKKTSVPSKPKMMMIKFEITCKNIKKGLSAS